MPTSKFARILPIAIATTALMGAPASTLARPLNFNTAPSSPLYIAQAAAPVGTYTADQGTVKMTGRFTRRSATSDTGTISKRRKNPSVSSSTDPATTSFKVVVNSFSPSSELQAVSAAGAGNLAEALAAYNHGSIIVNGTSYTVQLATYRVSQGNYVMQLVWSAPFSQTGNQGQTTSGNTVSMVELTVPTAGGAGTGTYYQSVQANVAQSGTVMVQGGLSGSTALSNVQKQ